MFNKKSILITGGTGSFGQAFAKKIFKEYPDIKRLVIFSRDELKQHEMSTTAPFRKNDKVRFFLGDIRDRERVKRALEGIDILIHAAALKHVPAAEYNPFEFVKTNIIGAQNVIDAVLDSDVSHVIALSTDKASGPINLYGATKLASDKLFIAANTIKGSRNLKLCIVRYGNVFGSRGSVVPYFLNLKETGTLPITNASMTRFSISLDAGVNMVLWAAANMIGGEIFVPKIPSFNILDLAEAICEHCDKPIVGTRPGEKIHEQMIAAEESPFTLDLGRYYAVLPSYFDSEQVANYCRTKNAKLMNFPDGYSSNKNADILGVEDLKALVSDYLNQVD